MQLSIFLINLFVGTYRLSSHARLEAFVIQTKLNLKCFRLAVYARNKHLIVNTSKSEVVHFNSAGENVPVLDVGGPPFITKILLGIWAWFSTGP